MPIKFCLKHRIFIISIKSFICFNLEQLEGFVFCNEPTRLALYQPLSQNFVTFCLILFSFFFSSSY